MKRIPILLLLLTILLPSTEGLFAQKKDSPEAELLREKIFEQLEKKEFIVDIQRLSAARVNRELMREHELILHNDSAYTSLPYVGRAYIAPSPSDDGGIYFKNSIENYKIKKGKKSYEVSFEVRHNSELFDVFMTVGFSGFVSLRISTPRRSSINYFGELILPQ